MYERLIENNKLNLPVLKIEKEFKKLKRKNSQPNVTESICLNLSKYKAGLTANGMPLSINKLAINGACQNGGLDAENNNQSGDTTSPKGSSRKLTIVEPSGLKIKPKFLKVHIDISFEKLQQNMQGHLLTLSIKNLHVEPLIEINHIKAKLSYVKVELGNGDSENENENNASAAWPRKEATPKFFVKLTRFKEKKCKFDRNLKNFAKAVDFELSSEHFMHVTEEAMRAQMKKLNFKMDDENGTANSDNAFNQKTYLFVFWIELHSYLPISRKTLSSTFRKQKRVFKGECHICENFVNFTEFPKTFIINEI